MSGFTRIRGLSALILGLAIIQIPPQLQAQTSAERARVEEIRRALERAEAQQQNQLSRIEEALVQAREQVAQQEFQTQEALAARMEVLERALVEAQAQTEKAQVSRERVLARQIEAQAEALVRLEQVRGQNQERALVRYQEQSQRALERAQEQMEKYQQVMVRVRSYIRLGVTLTSDQDEEMDRQGVQLSGVMDDSPAQEAGLQEGDILTHLNGHSLIDPIPNEDDEDFDSDESLPVQRLLALVQDLEEGDEVDLRYLRDGSGHEVSFLAAELDQPNVLVWSNDEGRRGLRGVYQVDPGEEGTWTFSGPDKELIELKLSELGEFKDLENLSIELSELEGLDRLKELRVFSKDGSFDSGNFRVHTSPEGQFRFYSSKEGDSPPSFNVWRRGDEAPSSIGFYERGDFPSSFQFWGRGAGFGLEVTELNPELGEYFSADAGLLILSVDDDENPLNLAAGDVVLAIGGRDVEDQGDLWRILGSYEEGETVTITVVRKGQQQEVEGSIG